MIASIRLDNGQRIAFDADPATVGNVRIRIMSDDMMETIATASEPQMNFCRGVEIICSQAIARFRA